MITNHDTIMPPTILGIDPGTKEMGLAVLETGTGFTSSMRWPQLSQYNNLLLSLERDILHLESIPITMESNASHLEEQRRSVIRHSSPSLTTTSNTPAHKSAPNTSGLGPEAPIPPEIRQWNWGAAVFSTIWCLANRLTTNRETLTQLLKHEGYKYGGVFFLFSLGSRGNELAWKYKRWPSLEVFLRVQKHWSVAGATFLATLGTAALGLIVVALVSLMKQ